MLAQKMSQSAWRSGKHTLDSIHWLNSSIEMNMFNPFLVGAIHFWCWNWIPFFFLDANNLIVICIGKLYSTGFTEKCLLLVFSEQLHKNTEQKRSGCAAFIITFILNKFLAAKHHQIHVNCNGCGHILSLNRLKIATYSTLHERWIAMKTTANQIIARRRQLSVRYLSRLSLIEPSR